MVKKELLLFFILSIFLCCCKRDVQMFKIHNLNGDKISCFGHGGMGVGFDYPIDTWESIEPVLRIGADGTEMDVQMTRDSVLEAYHNSYLSESTACNGTINDNLWADIESQDTIFLRLIKTKNPDLKLFIYPL